MIIVIGEWRKLLQLDWSIARCNPHEGVGCACHWIAPGNSKACVYNVDMKQAGNTGNANRLVENLPLGIEMNLSLCSKVQKSSANLFMMPLLAKNTGMHSWHV